MLNPRYKNKNRKLQCTLMYYIIKLSTSTLHCITQNKTACSSWKTVFVIKYSV